MILHNFDITLKITVFFEVLVLKEKQFETFRLFSYFFVSLDVTLKRKFLLKVLVLNEKQFESFCLSKLGHNLKNNIFYKSSSSKRKIFRLSKYFDITLKTLYPKVLKVLKETI